GSTSTNTNMILFGSGDAATLADGEETTVTVGGTSYTVKMIGVSSATVAVISVDGDSRSLTKGSSYNIKGLDIYVNDLYFFSKEGSVSSAKLSFGSSRITLTNGEAVKTGTSDTTVEGTLVTIGGTAEVATIEVAVAAADSSTAFLQEGTAFVDPVFGSFKLAFSGINPSLTDSGRDTVTIATSGSDRATVTATDYNGNTKSLDFARDPTTTVDDNVINFQDVNQYNYNVVEGASVTKSHYLVTDAGDFSHLFQVTGLSSLGTTSAKATLKDVFTGTSYEITLNNAGQGSKVIDGQVYYANVTATATPTIRLTWGAGSPTYADVGSKTTVFPGIKLKNGEYMYLTAKDQEVTLANNTASTIKLPAGAALGTAGDISAVYLDSPDQFNITVGSTLYSGATTYAVLVGAQYYNISMKDAIDAATEIVQISLATGATGTEIATPAVMVMEKKDDNSAYNTVVVTTGDDADSITLGTVPYITGANSGSQSSTSDSSVTRYVDLFGTLISVDTDASGTVTMSYPNSQAIAGVYALETAAVVPAVGVASATGTGTVNQPSLNGGLSKVDTEVTSADKTEKNLILVGGPAANALVAELAAANKTHSMDTWMADLVGKYVIQAVEDAFAEGKTAIVVAGYEYAQTQAASLKLATEALSGAEVQSA
ncbi:MAG: S-layer protein, partial [Candidatus Aenigmarchaeota archaeon]|nr:S-layer protein [Candidatus Aenigmarchaeota archaeon]